MTSQEFKRIGQLLKKAYSELQDQSLKEGIDIMSEQYNELVARTRLAVLKKSGFSLEEYQHVKSELDSQRKANLITKQDFADAIQGIHNKLNEIDQKKIINEEDVKNIATEIAQQHIKPHQIIHQIVKETTIEKPQIIRDTVIEKSLPGEKGEPGKDGVDGKSYNPTDFIALKDKVNLIPTEDKLVEIVKSEVKYGIENSTEILDMPNWRKMGMGLRGDLDALSIKVNNQSTGSSFPQLTQTQINALSPINGQTAYNTTNDTPQIYVAGSWYALQLA